MLPLVPLEVDGDIGVDFDGELVLPDDDIGVVLDPVDPPPAPVDPPDDPDAALLPLVVFDMLELSVLGAGGSFFWHEDSAATASASAANLIEDCIRISSTVLKIQA